MEAEVIKRSYAYNLTLQAPQPKFMCGVVTVISWLPDPNKAWRRIMDDAAEQWGCDRNKVRCESFTRV